jgi:membrane protein required for colicin V production
LTGLDALVFAILLISGGFAYIRGFVHELLTLVAWAGAALTTLYGFEYVVPVARDMISVRAVADIGTGLVIFVAVLVVLTILTRLLARRVQDSSLSTLDRSLGLVFGVLRAALLLSFIWVLVAWAVPRDDFPEWISEARTLPLIETGAGLLYALVPEHLQPESPPDIDANALELDFTFEELVNPQPKVAGPARTSGYKDRERKDLQRLIETSQ